MKEEIKGILVTFFREGTKGDYLEALNKAQNELLTVMEASKNLVQPNVSSNEAQPKENKKESEVAVCPRCGRGEFIVKDNFEYCTKCNYMQGQTDC